MPERSRLTAEIMESMFERLKEFIIDYRFHDESEEIFFFKKVKPHLFSQLIYHSKIYNIELNRPAVSSKVDFHQSGIEKGTRERVRSKVTKFGYHYKFLSSF